LGVRVPPALPIWGPQAGGVAEWSIATVLKTVKAKHLRGFESLPLRQQFFVKEFRSLFIWVGIIGVIFTILWRKGYLLRFADYVMETREELRKCSWPNVDELKGSTVVVMVTIALLGGFTVALDYVISKLLAFII
jgi:preprotein translocase SecE subunit